MKFNKSMNYLKKYSIFEISEPISVFGSELGAKPYLKSGFHSTLDKFLH